MFFRFREYKAGQQALDTTQPSLAAFAQTILLYNPNSPRQQQIHQAIINNAIIVCILPLSIVENDHFKHFLKVLDNKYTPIGRWTITEKLILVLVGKVKDTITEKLQSQPSVSITAEIWSGRILHSFLGVTTHSYKLESFLLDCRWFTGQHAAENITITFYEIVDEYRITNKVAYVITDNAANMKCAFKVKLPQQEEHSEESDDSENGNLHDEHLWEDVSWDDEENIDLLRSRQRLSCFAHSLQLVIHDGMKEVKAISLAIAKTSRFSTLPLPGIGCSSSCRPARLLTTGPSQICAAWTSRMWFLPLANGTN